MRHVSTLLLLAACTPAKPATTLPPPTTTTATPPATVPAVADARAKKVRTVEGITEYTLPNGLQVLMFPDPSQSTITVDVTYLVGSRLEGYGETGMAHLLEHMMFKGSPRFRNVLKIVEGKGGIGNGNTWTDRTTYFETLPASPDNLDWMLDLESDRMLHAAISKEDLSTEFSVVRNEFEIGENNPQGVLAQRVESTAYLWHNYGKDTIGSRADIERVPTETLRVFYEKYYQPDNATLVIAGKFDEAQALANVEKRFGVLPRPTRKLSDSYSVEPVQDGERTVTLRRNGDVAEVMVAYHTVGAASPDYPAVQAALDLLSHEPSGRLYKKLVDTKLAAQVRAQQYPFRDPWLAEIQAEVRDPKNVDRVQQTILADAEGLATAKIDDKEIERWKNQVLKEFDLAMTDSQRLAIELTESIALGDWRAMFAYRDRVKQVTAADVQRVAKAFFKTSNRTVGQYLPAKEIDRAPLQGTPSIADVVKGIDGGKSVAEGEEFAATLDNIEKRTTRKDLKGGLKAAFLSKKTRGGKVSLSLSLHWGDEKSLANKAMIGRAVAAMLQRGTATKSYEQIQDLEDKLKAQISITGGNAGIDIQIDTLKENLPAALDLVGEMLTAPAFPDKELEVIRQQTLAALEQERQEPQAVSFIELQQIASPWPKGDPRHIYSVPERIAIMKNLQMNDVKSFYRDFAGASHGELVAVGDFDQAAVTTQAEKLLASWQSKKPYARLADKAFGVAGTQKSIDIKDKEMTMIALAQDIAMKDTDPDYPAWLMVGEVLGGDTGSRMWMRLREKEGLSYGTGTFVQASSHDEAGGIFGYAMVAPQNLAKAKASILDEFTKMTTGKIDETELKRAKELWVKQQDTFLSNDNYVQNLLSTGLFDGRTTAFWKELRDKVSKVTTADVERVAKKWLHPDRLIVIDAGDHAKATAPEAPKK